MEDATKFRSLLCRYYDYFPMVPCSEFNNLINLCALRNAIFCSREEEAIAIGSGLLLGGLTPLVMVQCAGLMSSLNTLGSLVVTYRIPLVIAVAMRGGPNEINSTQVPAARATRIALDTIGCETVSVSRESVVDALIQACPANRLHCNHPIAVLMED